MNQSLQKKIDLDIRDYIVRTHNCQALYKGNLCLILGDYCLHSIKENCEHYLKIERARQLAEGKEE